MYANATHKLVRYTCTCKYMVNYQTELLNIHTKKKKKKKQKDSTFVKLVIMKYDGDGLNFVY